MTFKKLTLCSAVFLTVLFPVLSRKVEYYSIEPISTRFDKYTTPFTPMYAYVEGCTSYPAVARNGDYSNGQSNGGSPGQNCRDLSRQQVYTRALFFNPTERKNSFQGIRNAVMYAMFFPKDQGNRHGIIALIEGHRYDWEEIVVFFDMNGNAVKAAFSEHAGYRSIDRSPKYARFWTGNRVHAKYGIMPSEFRSGRGIIAESFKNNAFYPQEKVSPGRPKEGCWSYLTPAMRASISNVDWGHASPKIKDSFFRGKISEAWKSSLF